MSFRNFFARGADNTNLEIGRALWALSVVAGIAYSGVHLVLHGNFDIITYGTGMGALLLGGGGAIAAKDSANKAAPVGDGS